MALTKASLIDLNGQELILDADADTSITADTDDQIDFKIGGTDVATLTAGTLKVVNTGNTDTLILESTDADANTGPVMVLHRNSASPAEGDLAGEIRFDSEDTAGNQTTIAKIQGILGHPNHGQSYAEDGRLTFSIIKDASLTEVIRISEDARVGIGTNDPAQNLHIHCDSGDEGILLKSTGNTSNAITIDANRSSGGGALGEIRGLWNGTEVARIVLRGGDDTTNKDDGFITFATSSADNISERMRIASGGQVTIGTTNTDQASGAGIKLFNDGSQARCFLVGSGSGGEGFSMYDGSNYKFYVGYNGTINATNNSISTISDERLKENIRDLDKGLNDILKLKPRRFDWKTGEGSDTKNVSGFVAQECEEAGFDEFVGDFKHKELDDAKSFGQGGLIPALVKAIQEQQTQIEALQSEINTLKGE